MPTSNSAAELLSAKASRKNNPYSYGTVHECQARVCRVSRLCTVVEEINDASSAE